MKFKACIIRFYILSLLVFFPTYDILAKSAIFITIDGLRPDSITENSSPNLLQLLAKSSYTLKASTVYPSLTIPSHTSLFTGLDVRNHNIRFNQWNFNSDHINVPTIFSLIVKHNASFSFVCGKKKLLFLLSDNLLENTENSIKCYDVDEDKRNIENKIASFFLNDYKNNKHSLSFVHFPQPDKEGHIHGWLTKQYNDALRNVDREIGHILNFIDSTGKKDILLIITADHGGHEKTHGTNNEIDMTIPWIAYGRSIKANHRIDQKIFIYDTLPTVLNYLNIESPSGLDGKPVYEIFK